VPIRTKTRTVTFPWSFYLDEIDRELPAGSYTVETDEEALETVSYLAYRRVETRLFIPPATGRTGAEMWIVDPDGLDRALERDLVTPGEPNRA